MQSPKHSKVILTECFKFLDQIKIKNFDRTLSKQAMICGHELPEHLEGKIVNLLFEWLGDPKKSVSTKSNCLFALEKLCQKYPVLKEELIAVVKEQKEWSTKSFQQRAEKVLLRLRED